MPLYTCYIHQIWRMYTWRPLHVCTLHVLYIALVQRPRMWQSVCVPSLYEMSCIQQWYEAMNLFHVDREYGLSSWFWGSSYREQREASTCAVSIWSVYSSYTVALDNSQKRRHTLRVKSIHCSLQLLHTIHTEKAHTLSDRRLWVEAIHCFLQLPYTTNKEDTHTVKLDALVYLLYTAHMESARMDPSPSI